MSKDPEFYKRMLEAKARKQKALEQKRLEDEFITSPEKFVNPLGQTVIVKSEVEQRIDNAFQQLQVKLHGEKQIKQDHLTKALDNLNDKLSGL